MKRPVVAFLYCLGIVSAADVSISESDFIERFVNFVIFFSILWYLGADKIKSIFSQRTRRILKRFEVVQEEEKTLKRQIEEAEAMLADARLKSAEIIANARREAFLIAQQFDMRLEQDVKTLSHSFDEILKQKKVEILKDEVSRTINCASETLCISDDAYMKILIRGIKQ